MARVSANLLYVVIYGPVLSCTPDPGGNPPDPADEENGGYTNMVFQQLQDAFGPHFWKMCTANRAAFAEAKVSSVTLFVILLCGCVQMARNRSGLLFVFLRSMFGYGLFAALGSFSSSLATVLP